MRVLIKIELHATRGTRFSSIGLNGIRERSKNSACNRLKTRLTRWLYFNGYIQRVKYFLALLKLGKVVDHNCIEFTARIANQGNGHLMFVKNSVTPRRGEPSRRQVEAYPRRRPDDRVVTTATSKVFGYHALLFSSRSHASSASDAARMRAT